MEVDLPQASTSRSVSTQALPYITVQHDLQGVLQDVVDGTVASESFWVSVYKQGFSSIHGRVVVRPSLEDETQVDLEAEGGIVFERDSSTRFYVTCEALDVPKTLVCVPKHIHKSRLNQGVDCMDVSPNSELFVAGGHDGKLQVDRVRDSTAPPLVLVGHVGDVLSCHFFPSSEVVLSTSSDLSIRVFSALDGSNPRVLTGHTAAVTDAAILGRGRHVVSTSNDGTVKLWLIGEAKCLKSWRLGRKRATSIVITSKVASSSQDHSAVAPGVSDADGYFGLVGAEDGTISILDMQKASFDPPVHIFSATSTCKAISALAIIQSRNRHVLASGTTDGEIKLFAFDTSLTEAPEALVSFKRNDADITSLAFQPSDSGLRLLAATADGLPFRLDLNVSTFAVAAQVEYAGYDIDACNVIVSVDGTVYSAGKDGSLRRY